jgi:hypothetical protein
VLLFRGATVHVKATDQNTLVVSARDLMGRPLPQLCLHRGKKTTEVEWLPAENQIIGGTIGWVGATDAHYRRMFALLVAAGAKR